jgi:muconolactone delta-isomerase
MLFLVRAEVGTVPPGELGDLLERVEREWEMVLALATVGRILACGKLARRRGAVAIFDIEDRAALDAVVAGLPLAPLFERLDIEALEPAEAALAAARRQRRIWQLLQMGGARGNGRPPRGAPPEAGAGG